MYFDLHQQRQVKAEPFLHHLQSSHLLSYTAVVRSLQTLILDSFQNNSSTLLPDIGEVVRHWNNLYLCTIVELMILKSVVV